MAETIKDMVDDNSRINYRLLTNYVSRCALPLFVGQIKHPLLVGKDLYDGELMQNFSKTSTMQFKITQDLADSLPKGKDSHESITRAIYMLRKKPFSGGMPNSISIGRVAENDITIVDYSISRRHAEILLVHGRYFLVDMGGTNGTSINGEFIQPNVQVKLEPDSPIAFGRVIFVFMPAEALYQKIRASSDL